MRIINIFITIFLLINFSFANDVPEPPNLGILKKSIKNYIESGSYERDIQKVVDNAINYLYSRYDKVEKPAVVFDIDETLLSNLEYEYRYDFGFSYSTWNEWVREANAKAIKPTQKLYKICQNLNVSVFIITGRNQIDSDLANDPTVINLKKEGFYGWKKLYLKPMDVKMSTVEYKSSCRREIEEMGYKIIINMGDQWSDLLGGYSEQIFKLPNPMYFVP
ncbi:MAG: HAD family acid phosphatase [Candidatus Micrarchaeia archaeon]